MYTLIGAIGGAIFVALFFRSNMQLHLLGPSASLIDCLTNSSSNLFSCTDYGQFVLPLIFGTVVGGAMGSVVDRLVAKKDRATPSAVPNTAGNYPASPLTSDIHPQSAHPVPDGKADHELTGNLDQEQPRHLAIDDSPDGLLAKGLSYMQIAQECSIDCEYLQLMSRAYHDIKQAIGRGGSTWPKRDDAERFLIQIRRAVNTVQY